MYKATFMPSKDESQILEFLFSSDFFVTSLECAIMVICDSKPTDQSENGNQATELRAPPVT